MKILSNKYIKNPKRNVISQHHDESDMNQIGWYCGRFGSVSFV